MSEMESRLVKVCKSNATSGRGGLNVPELRTLAKSRGISVNVSKMNRDELVLFLCGKVPSRMKLPVLIEGSGRSAGIVQAIKTELDKVGYEHVVVEHGSGGHCGYCSFTAGINHRHTLMKRADSALKDDPLLSPKKYQDMRELVAHAIEKKVNDETIMALYMQEYEEFPSGLAEARKKLADATRKNRWATEFDVNILHNIFNVGIFLINKDVLES